MTIFFGFINLCYDLFMRWKTFFLLTARGFKKFGKEPKVYNVYTPFNLDELKKIHRYLTILIWPSIALFVKFVTFEVFKRNIIAVKILFGHLPFEEVYFYVYCFMTFITVVLGASIFLILYKSYYRFQLNRFDRKLYEFEAYLAIFGLSCLPLSWL